jgi:hypothetical protein
LNLARRLSNRTYQDAFHRLAANQLPLFPAPSSAVLQQIAVEAEPCHDEAVAAPDEAGYLSASQAAAA